MLEKLDEVPWSALEHAYGPATDAPGLIRALASPERKAREKAIRALYGNLWHQGTVYEATAHAVPFLLELLDDPTVASKDGILIYLKHLAFGSSYLNAHQDLLVFQDERDKPDFNERMNVELGWVRDANRAVAKGHPIYRRLLDDIDPKVRAAAADLVTYFPDDAESSAAALESRFQVETEETALASIAFALCRLPATTPGVADLLSRIVEAHPSAPVKTMAAVGLAYKLGRETPPEARQTIVAALADAGSLNDVLKGCPWVEHDAQVYLAAAIRTCGAREALPDLLAAMDSVSPMDSWSIVKVVLNLAFDGKPLPSRAMASGLTDVQREALTAVASSRKFWTGVSETRSVGNVSEIMRAFNLPEAPARLRAFLRGETTTPK